MEEDHYYREDKATQASLQPSLRPTNSLLPNLSSTSHFLILMITLTLILLGIIWFRLVSILSRGPAKPRPRPRHGLPSPPTHLLIILGSGGHTAEMLNMLSQTPNLPDDFTYRTYVVSSGDAFSALKAHEFEQSLLANVGSLSSIPDGTEPNYDVVTVHRARKVHQSILTTPISSLRCLWDCIAVLRGTHPDLSAKKSLDGRRRLRRPAPDLILTNGPGTGVIVILASIVLRFFGDAALLPEQRSSSSAQTGGQMRSIFIESWARVRTLSLSGRLLRPFVDRFIVQWPQLAETGASKVEYIGPLVT
ncbi:hypothetical protein A1O1_07735 [Capronia coronata CBS 617.96]|uniref:UDP-N-acetylglucosamine transferase subunit ALG14 n=1 Tax=Capronia coronata CBS 617.96 TaxID=1182541 RepID=W9XWD0_9EURO|nr:uncharacterized protein A1O1_07735 [Capronia coronata CBS 617.96]EXJ81670.1 hypothetical protein A1O1_07735 [Capronia coronata CBS 617.96]